MNLPKRPACFGQDGPLKCECGPWPLSKSAECIERRYFWTAAKIVAEMRTNRERVGYIELLGSLRGPVAANQLRAAAKELMAEAA